jgi:hypothetical protein
MRKSVFLCIFVFCVSLVSYGRTTMKQVFINMPDSVFPYLTRNNRLDCVDFIESKMKAEIKNKFDENSELVTLTDDYLKIHLNENCVYEIKLLNTSDSLQLICFIRSYHGPEEESKIEFYSLDWKRLDGQQLMNKPSFDSFWHKPDSMSVERFEALRKYIDPVMMSASFSEPCDIPTIIFRLAEPLLNKEDKIQLKPVCMQISVKWNGEIFK